MGDDRLPPYGPLAQDVIRTPLVDEVNRASEAILRHAERATLEDRAAHTPLFGMEQGNPFAEMTIDLAATGLSTGLGVNVSHEGYAIHFRKENSNPGARLLIDIGGVTQDFYPGQRLEGFFRRFTVRAATRSQLLGTARLVIEKRPDCRYVEPNVEVMGTPFAPIDLLGNSAAGTFIAVAENTQPTGATPDGSFNINGVSQIRVLVDGQAANTLTSTNLIPWIREPNGAIWYEQGEEILTLPDSIATAYRYRTFIRNISGAGLMFFEIRSLLPALQTQLGFIVQATR